jgi:hypothetical protein
VVVSDLDAAVSEALEVLRRETGLDEEALFGERPLEPEQLSPTGAHAFGLVEGAGIALGLTALELLDELSAPRA